MSPRSDSFLWQTKIYFRENCFWSCYSRHVWHMIRLMHGNRHLQYPKSTRSLQNQPPETQKEVIQTGSCFRRTLGSRRFKSQNREKSSWQVVWRKRKEKIFKIRNWLLLHVEQYKTVVEEQISSENSCIITIILWDVWMFYQIFLSPQVKRSTNISNKKGVYELPHELPNDLKRMILWNKEKSEKSQNLLEW